MTLYRFSDFLRKFSPTSRVGPVPSMCGKLALRWAEKCKKCSRGQCLSIHLRCVRWHGSMHM